MMINKGDYYYAPGSFSELFEIKRQLAGEKFCYLAGGTDLKLPSNDAMTAAIDLKKIPGMDTIRYEGDIVRIGALTAIQTLETSSVIKERLPLISQAAKVFGSRQIRLRATVGGNICNRSASADIGCALLCSGAGLIWETENGSFEESLAGFYERCRMGTFDSTGMILKEVTVPVHDGQQAKYRKLGERKSMDIGLVNCAVLKRDDRISIALGSVSSTPVRAIKAEQVYEQSKKAPNADLIEAIADTAMKEYSPIDDIYASAEYRRDMVRSLLKEILADME